jgi:hypothetical protein
MNFQVDVGAWCIAVEGEAEGYEVTSESTLVERVVHVGGDKPRQGSGCVVEVVHKISGMRPHGLVAANFEPADDGAFHLTAVRGGSVESEDEQRTSPLGLSVSVALPANLAEAAVEGFMSSPTRTQLLPGVAHILGGAVDHDSSPVIFQHAGALAREVIMAVAVGVDPRWSVEKLAQSWA